MLKATLKSVGAGILALGLSATSVFAESHEGCDVNATGMEPSGKVTGTITTLGLYASARWGEGILSLNNGSRYRFRVIGAKVFETGVARDAVVGEVYNLINVADFEGTYWGASRNIKIGSLGKGEGLVNNRRCVIIKFRMEGSGLKVSGPAPGAVEIAFID